MKTIIGYTISDLMEKTGKSRNAIESWICIHKIKPLTNEVIYPPDTLDKLLRARRGRPPKKQA
ncbi:MAG: hypothetical protein FWH41_04680 [Treponema sp.]|nr:hypothetical protein [Treponema sp.]